MDLVFHYQLDTLHSMCNSEFLKSKRIDLLPVQRFMCYLFIQHDIKEQIIASPCLSLHPRPLDAKTPDPLPTALLPPTNQPALLHASAQPPAAHNIHQIDFLVPLDAHSQEMRVEPQRIRGVDAELAAEPQAGRCERCAAVGRGGVRC